MHPAGRCLPLGTVLTNRTEVDMCRFVCKPTALRLGDGQACTVSNRFATPVKRGWLQLTWCLALLTHIRHPTPTGVVAHHSIALAAAWHDSLYPLLKCRLGVNLWLGLGLRALSVWGAGVHTVKVHVHMHMHLAGQLDKHGSVHCVFSRLLLANRTLVWHNP